MTLAVLWVVACAAAGPSYEALVAEGLAEGRSGRLVEAAALFDQAIVLDPSRPEARVERGGVRFLEGRYEDAVVDLEAALRLAEDAYARDLLASALFLAGRPEDALAHWNRMGRPGVRHVSVSGLARTHDHVARSELRVREGEVLALGALRESRLRLVETGAFDRVSIRPVPLGEGLADAEVVLVERDGLATSWVEFVATTAVYAIQERALLRYSNLGGEGISVGAQYRWEENRPEASAVLQWPRPLGLGANLRVRGFVGEELYEVGEPSRREAHGAELRLRRVLGPATVGQLGFRTASRTFSPQIAEAPDGRVLGFEGGFDRRVADRNRLRLDASARVFGASTGLGSDIGFARAVGRLRALWRLSPRRDDLERSILAFQLTLGLASSGTPLDEAFAPGASPDMELPLRGRPQVRDGAFGETPLSRELVLANAEWRRRLWGGAGANATLVLFHDQAHLGSVYVGPGASFYDIGVGFRLGIAGSVAIRLDWGHGLTDGRDALSVGLGNVF
ncbi:MAG TPA: POTRA domain-containing protein [Vicinamibacteria bacterium]|nr:POTRA domain-containing protein [Vicinamibacteria bacterium]